jgi:plasmid maintenance system antidote protein VapI
MSLVQTTNEQPNAPRLRGELAEAGLHIYEIAGAAKMHPRTIGEMLNERRPLTPDAAERIQRAIREAKPQIRSAPR